MTDELTAEERALVDRLCVVRDGAGNEFPYTPAPAPPEEPVESARRFVESLGSGSRTSVVHKAMARQMIGDILAAHDRLRDELRKAREERDQADKAAASWRESVRIADAGASRAYVEVGRLVRQDDVHVALEDKLSAEVAAQAARIAALEKERDEARAAAHEIEQLWLHGKWPLGIAPPPIAARIAALEGALRRLEKAELAYRSAPHMLDGIEAEMGRTWAEMLAAGDAARALLAPKEAPRG